MEDGFGIANALTVLLEDEDHRVFAANGKQALERLAEVRPYLVASDTDDKARGSGPPSP